MPKTIIFTKYQKRADNYHWQQIRRNVFSFNAFVMARYQQVINLIPQNADQKILDIGCGDGVLLSFIKQGKLFGVDLNQAGLNYARTKVKAKFVQTSATKLPFPASFFDVVLATEIIEHLTKPEKMLKEISRVIKPNGKVIITTPVKLTDEPQDKMHVKEYSLHDLNQILKKYFTNVNIYQSHPLIFKQIYSQPLFKINRFYFEPFKWFINLWVLLTGLNPFKLSFLKNSNQLVVCSKPL